MENQKRLGEEDVKKLLLKFSIPAIVGMLVQSLYNVVDRIFIGKGVGELALSGVGVTFPIMIIIMAFGMLVGIGAAARISIRLGQNKREEAEKILGNAFVLTIIFAVVIMIFGLMYVDKILIAFGAGENILPYAKEYINVILIGTIFQNLGFSLNHCIRAEGSPKIAMYTMLIGGITNTILDPIFIFVFKMGVKGAAIATIISQLINTIWVVSHFLRGNSVLKIKRENLKLDKKVVMTIFSIGMSPFAMQLASSIIQVLYNKNLSRYGGELSIGAFAAINGIIMIFFMPIFGINQGVQPIIGFNYGAKKYERVRKAYTLAALAATFIVILGFIVMQLFPRVILSLFTEQNSETMNIASHGMRIFTLMLPVIGFQIVSSNMFQAIGKATISMFLSLSRQVIILIPLLLILPRIFGLNGVWACAPISDFIATALTSIFVIIQMRKFKDEKINS